MNETAPRKWYVSDTEYLAYRQQNSKRLPPQGGIIFLHGFRSDMEGVKAEYLAGWCEKQDVGYTRFDCFGHGLSSGAFTKGTIGRWLNDCATVLDHLTQGPQIVVGSSMGGWLMLLLALKRPERIAGLVGIAAAPDFTETLLWDTFTPSQKADLETHGEMQLASGDCQWPITRQLILEGREHLLLSKGALPLTCPVTLMHSRQDQDVPYQTALQLADSLPLSDVTLHLVPDDDHRMSHPASLARLAHAVENMVASTLVLG